MSSSPPLAWAQDHFRTSPFLLTEGEHWLWLNFSTFSKETEDSQVSIRLLDTPPLFSFKKPQLHTFCSSLRERRFKLELWGRGLIFQVHCKCIKVHFAYLLYWDQRRSTAFCHNKLNVNYDMNIYILTTACALCKHLLKHSYHRLPNCGIRFV